MMGVGPVFGGANLASAWSGSSFLFLYNGLVFVFFIEGVESGGRSCFRFVPAQDLTDNWEICTDLFALCMYRLSPSWWVRPIKNPTSRNLSLSPRCELVPLRR